MPKHKININRLKLKHGMSHYGHESILDAKFESGSSFSSRGRTKFPSEEGTSHQIRLFTLGKLLNFKK